LSSHSGGQSSSSSHTKKQFSWHQPRSSPHSSFVAFAVSVSHQPFCVASSFASVNNLSINFAINFFTLSNTPDFLINSDAFINVNECNFFAVAFNCAKALFFLFIVILFNNVTFFV
jgi:hypothetical protein